MLYGGRAALVMLVGAIAGGRLWACGFVESASNRPTLREDAATCRVLLYGTLANPKEGTGTGGGITDLVVTRALKDHLAVKGQRVVRLGRYISVPDPKNPPRLLVFGDVTDGRPDFYRGQPATPALVDYVAGAMTLDAKDRSRALRHFADFLEHPDPDIAADAFAEFLKSQDADIRAAGRTIPADRVRKWLRSEKTAPDRLRLYAFLLAQSGTRADAALLRDLLDRRVKEASPPLLDGVLTAYTLLDPKEGWAYACGLLKDPKLGFLVRYAALRAARYFHTSQPDAVPEKDRLAAMSLSLGHRDLADLAIDYLREWRCWKLTAEVLAVAGREDLNDRLNRGPSPGTPSGARRSRPPGLWPNCGRPTRSGCRSVRTVSNRRPEAHRLSRDDRGPPNPALQPTRGGSRVLAGERSCGRRGRLS
jgi:hypothetical protein